MKKKVVIILNPEIHKSQNGAFFEDLMRSVFDTEGYNLEQNINFTGLEIDLKGTHKNRNETLLVECKAKEKPLSSEIKSFIFNVKHKKFDYGYFLHSEELDHQAGGLKSEIEANNEYKNITFFGPDKIITSLEDAGKIKPFKESPNTKGSSIYNLILAYTYFGAFYIIVASKDASRNNYFLINATTGEEILNVEDNIDKTNTNSPTIDEALKLAIEYIKNLNHSVSKEASNNSITNVKSDTKITIKKKYLAFLNDAGASFIHSQANEVNLSDIFVFPDLSLMKNAIKGKSNYINSETLCNVPIPIDGLKLTVSGEEGSGKTSLCKTLYKKLYESNLFPIYIEGSEFGKVELPYLKQFLDLKLNTQYNTPRLNYLQSLELNKVVLIIDDFQKIKFNRYGKSLLISNLNLLFQNIIVAGNTQILFDPFTERSKGLVDAFEEYKQYQLTELGRELRYKLAKKWNSIGQELTIDKNELLRKTDNAVSHINGIIGKNFIPAYPIYILTLLQSIESHSTIKLEYSLHGFYYDLLINQRLNKAVKKKEDISLYYNFICEYAFFLQSNKIGMAPITYESFTKFFNKYCEDYTLKNISCTSLVNTLCEAKLLSHEVDEISIQYKYN